MISHLTTIPVEPVLPNRNGPSNSLQGGSIVINVGSDTFGNPNFLKGLQN